MRRLHACIQSEVEVSWMRQAAKFSPGFIGCFSLVAAHMETGLHEDEWTSIVFQTRCSFWTAPQTIPLITFRPLRFSSALRHQWLLSGEWQQKPESSAPNRRLCSFCCDFHSASIAAILLPSFGGSRTNSRSLTVAFQSAAKGLCFWRSAWKTCAFLPGPPLFKTLKQNASMRRMNHA